MEKNKPKTPQKNAVSKLKELSKKRRENLKPSKELIEILQNPTCFEQTKPKTPKKGAVKRMRELFERNRGKASSELIDALKSPPSKKP